MGLRPEEIEAIRDWVGAGGQAAAVGKVVKELADFRLAYRKHAEVAAWVKDGEQIIVAEGSRDVGFGLHERENGYTLHLVNYKLNSITREIEPIPSIIFTLSWTPNEVQVHTFPERGTQAVVEGNVLTVSDIGIYTVVDLHQLLADHNRTFINGALYGIATAGGDLIRTLPTEPTTIGTPSPANGPAYVTQSGAS